MSPHPIPSLSGFNPIASRRVLFRRRKLPSLLPAY